MLDVIDPMACLRSSVGISYLSTIGIIVSMVSRVMHIIISIEHINFVTTDSLYAPSSVASPRTTQSLHLQVLRWLISSSSYAQDKLSQHEFKTDRFSFQLTVFTTRKKLDRTSSSKIDVLLVVWFNSFSHNNNRQQYLFHFPTN